jgi:hypothetical protein
VAIAVFDIDGVVADVRHRLGHLKRRPKDWARFFESAGADPLLTEGRDLVRQRQAAGEQIVWLTGRPAWLRAVTIDWLVEHELPTDELLMRAGHDYRPAALIKVDALTRLHRRSVTLFVDDDPDVVRAATAAGFPSTLASWVPHSKTLHTAQEHDGRT